MFNKFFAKQRESEYTLPVMLFLVILSIVVFLVYFNLGKHLPYADSMSRLDIARKVVDNLNPGLAQLGSVWLPLPQLLMVPFVWNNYLWQSGIAGAIMSMSSFILGGFFLYKSAFLISKRFIPSFFTLCIYALNVNALYLQTTALSECVFMCALFGVMYFFLLWINTYKRRHLLFAAMAVSAITLIRYEGIALLLASIGFVAVYSYYHDRSYKKLEGQLIMYCCVACLGFALWTLYLTAIFGDPLFWLRYYGFGPKIIIPGATVSVPTQAKPFMAAVWQYFTSVTWMSGIIPIVFAVVGVWIGLIRSYFSKSWNILVILIPMSIYLLMVMTLRRNTPIVQPNLSMENIMSTKTSTMTGFNIRYGIMMLPMVALLTIYVFDIKKTYYIPAIVLFAIFTIQVVNTYVPRFSPIYEIPFAIGKKPDISMVKWMQKNYTGGYIMMSASGFEDQMFLMGFPYRTYIHEGAGKYWTEALDRPARYADYIIIDFSRESDTLAKEFKNKQYWNWDYNLVWEEKGSNAKIYKIKTHPDIIIQAN